MLNHVNSWLFDWNPQNGPLDTENMYWSVSESIYQLISPTINALNKQFSIAEDLKLEFLPQEINQIEEIEPDKKRGKFK